MKGLNSLTLALLAITATAAPAWAVDPAPETDEKLPAQLPSVTIQGEDLSGSPNQNQGKISPGGTVGTQRVRLPEPPQRRATSEGNRSLMVSVTPSTLETPAPLPGAVMPYTSVLGGYGPVTQFRVGLYDARLWGPAIGITEVDGRSGWGWSGWRGKEWLDWGGVGRLNLEGQGFAWDRGAHQGGQSFLSGGFEHGESEDLLARFDVQRGQLGRATGAASPLNAADLAATLTRGHLKFRPLVTAEHQLTLQLTGQYRAWGTYAAPEAYLHAGDFWSLSDVVQLEAGLGGGYWGLEPILDPKIAFHYRPQAATHLYASLRTQTELPDFADLYLRRPATAANTGLQAERVEGWAELGASHRLTDAVWAGVDAGLRRSHRHIYWADPTGSGLWTPLNAGVEQYSPTAGGRAQIQWADALTQSLDYRYTTVQPLGMTEQRVGTSLETRFLDDKLGLGAGVEGRFVSLSSQQLPGGGQGMGVFAEASFDYALSKDVTVSLTASDVPLSLSQPGNPGSNFFVPIPLLTANVQYQF